MLPHDCEGTQRLELPVSRMTLKSWGGLPMEISEKSGGEMGGQYVDGLDWIGWRAGQAGRQAGRLTLGVHEVADGDGVVLGGIDLGRLEHGVDMADGPSAHVLLAQAAHLRVDGDGLELVGQRHLLELHLVDGGLGAAKQRARLRLPPLPVTTIGSFPQTAEVRSVRARAARGEIRSEERRGGEEG